MWFEDADGMWFVRMLADLYKKKVVWDGGWALGKGGRIEALIGFGGNCVVRWIVDIQISISVSALPNLMGKWA
jgi:hypothetical protein